MSEELEEMLIECRKDDFQHLYNPLHMYERLRKMGIDKQESLSIVKIYEAVTYKPLNKKHFGSKSK